jgi:CheY-like chemotaxis protein
MSTSQRKVILLVDDDADVRASVGTLLGLVGFHVEKATDGQEALSYLRTHPAPSLIILDLLMPGMDGWEFRKEQRRDSTLAHIPVVVISSDFHFRDRDVLGEVDYCPKGSDPLNLVHLVEAVCA